jgi:hypothetical protein
MNKLITIIILSLLLLSCRAENIGIYKITVLNNNFQQIRIIDQPQILKEINELWGEFEPIDEFPDMKWTYKLDIDSNKLSGRWLYNEAGYLGKLNKQLKPMFKIKNQETFNKLLGF